MKTVSIIITCFNKQDFIERCIRSVLQQVHIGFNIEVIVVDDCSTDNSRKRIENVGSKVKTIFLPENQGVARASNIGIASSSGQYWMRVDGDDYLSNTALLKLFPILDFNEDFAFVFGDMVKVNRIENNVERISMEQGDNLLQHGAGILFRSSIFDKKEPYDPEFKNAEDCELIARLIAQGARYFHLPVPLYRYNIHGNNLTLEPDRVEFFRRAKSRWF